MASSPTEETPAAHRVLNTTELLEQILLNLDTKTLLLSMRTNRRFNNVIDGSIYLQEALFFKQAPGPDGGKEYGRHGINPLLVGPDNVTSLDIRTRIHLNTGVMRWTSSVQARPRYKRGVYKRGSARAVVPDSVARTGASWRQMYVRHGPLLEASPPPFIDMKLHPWAGWRWRELVSVSNEPRMLGYYEELAWEKYEQRVKRERASWDNPLTFDEGGMETLLERLRIIGVLDDDDIKEVAGSKRRRW